jgi:hypothetical protein
LCIEDLIGIICRGGVNLVIASEVSKREISLLVNSYWEYMY